MSEAEVSGTDVRRAAMDLLARREHARSELVTKLRRRFPSVPVLIEEVIDTLADEGLQSDARFAESFVRTRISKGQGPLKIKAELGGRGIDDATMALAFEECQVDWPRLAASVCEKRFGSGVPVDAKERARRCRFLQQRGFAWDHISDIF